MSEKTEPPTPKRLRDAREKGNLMSSKEVVSTFVMLCGLLAVYVVSTDVPMRFRRALDEMLALIGQVDFGTQAVRFAGAMVTEMLAITGVVFGAIILGAVLSNVGQIGIYFSLARFSKGLQSLDPVSNLKNMFSKKTLTQFGVNLVKVGLILGIAWWKIEAEWVGLIEKIYACRSDILCGLPVAASTAFGLLMWIVLAMVPVAVIDWAIQRYLYLKDLKMSIDEVRREHKEQEGSPEMKGHRKQVAHEIVHEDPAPRTRQASVVVRNPTHVAVALRYEPGVVPLPYVVCKGVGLMAERIIREAERHGVPTFEDVPLARGLNDACEVGEHVPTAYIEPVARVIRWLYLNYPQRVFDGDDGSLRAALQAAPASAPSSYSEASTYGGARAYAERASQ
jgi:type III secretion protein U